MSAKRSLPGSHCLDAAPVHAGKANYSCPVGSSFSEKRSIYYISAVASTPLLLRGERGVCLRLVCGCWFGILLFGVVLYKGVCSQDSGEGELSLLTNDPRTPEWKLSFRGRGVSALFEIGAEVHEFESTAVVQTRR